MHVGVQTVHVRQLIRHCMVVKNHVLMLTKTMHFNV